MRRRICSIAFLFTALAALSTCGESFGDDPQSSTREPLFISLWAEDPTLDLEEASRDARMLRTHLNETLGERLAGSGFSTVQVDVLSSFEAVMRARQGGRHLLIECDPAVMFADSEEMKVAYSPVLQHTRPRVGVILTMRAGSKRRPLDLKGATVAAVHPYSSAGGIYQSKFLQDAGIAPGLDFELHYSGHPSEAVKMLVSNWVDAVFVPQGTELALWENLGLDKALLNQFVRMASVGPVPGSVFLLRDSNEDPDKDIRQYLVAGLESYYGNQVVPTKKSYYVTLENLVRQGTRER